jgi:hypothetical protein
MSEFVRREEEAGIYSRSVEGRRYLIAARRSAWRRIAPVQLHPVQNTVHTQESFSIVTRAELAAHPEWTAAFTGQLKDWRYYEMVEDTLHPEFEHRYLVFRDGCGAVTSIQPIFILHQDMLGGMGGQIDTAVSFIRRCWPGFLRMRTLMIGCAAGEGHLAGRTDARQLGNAALKAAREYGAGLVVFKEFPSAYRDKLQPLKTQHFQRLPSLPMATLDIQYEGFDAYMTQTLSRATRKDLRRKFKAAEHAGLKMSVLEDITPFIDEVYPLYLQVYKRSKLQFEKLTPGFLCQLGQKMPNTMRFFIWRRNARIVALNVCMVQGETIYDQYIGFDYTVALDLHLYHYTFRDIVTWAIAQGYKTYVSNSLNYDPKLHLRMRLDPLDLYVRHTSPFMNAILKKVLPRLEPTRHDKYLKKFANYHELWGQQ